MIRTLFTYTARASWFIVKYLFTVLVLSIVVLWIMLFFSRSRSNELLSPVHKLLRGQLWK